MRQSVRISLLVMALSILLAGTALATPASGFHPTILSRGSLSHRVDIHTRAVDLKTKRATDIVNATVTFDPASTSGWHRHPGIVLVTVVSGTLVVYDDDCESTVQPAGSAFIESGSDAGLVRNESSTTPAVVNVTYLVPKRTLNTQLRVDKPNPGCPQN